MKKFSIALLIVLLMMSLAFASIQSSAQQNSPTATATSTAFLTPNPTQIHATLTALPRQFSELSSSQERALQNLMRLGTVQFNPDGSIDSTISISEAWLNDAVAVFSPLTGYSRDELYLDIQADGVSIRINQDGNAVIVHCVGSISANTLVADFDWMTYNGVAMDVSWLAEDETVLNNLLPMQVNTMLNSRVFSYTLDSMNAYDGYIVLEATLRFRD